MLGYVSNVFNGGFMKWVSAIIAGLIALIFPTETMQRMAFVSFVLIFLDTVSALIAAFAKGDKIRSARLAAMFVKMAGYMSVFLVFALIGWALEEMKGFSHFAIGATLGFIIFTESVSILENLMKAGIKFPKGLTEKLQTILEMKESKIDSYNSDSEVQK